MFALREGEDGRQSENRAIREAAAADALLKQRDKEDAPNPLEELAAQQLVQLRLRREVDWAGIIEGRAQAPQFFVHLPDDEECRSHLPPPMPPAGELREVSRVDEVLVEPYDAVVAATGKGRKK
jgi:hypothetical protein